ncbi:MAG: hypothetical protein KY455_06770 [Euryarchaeota archaeon]|nr:hypothetical protein [Euryarchaeota archaeon]
MLRLLALPFVIALGIVSFLVLMGGVATFTEAGEAADDHNGGGLFGLFDDGREEREAAEAGMAVGAGLVAIGVIGLVGSVALLIAALSGGSDDRPYPVPAWTPAPTQQQQQQVVVVTDGDARVETR